MLPRDDPAERSGYLRFFYRNWRPTLLGRTWSKGWAWVSGLGLTPRVVVSLQTIARDTGRLNGTILVVAEHAGRRYVVSMLGSGSQWVQNIRAAHGRAFIKRWRLQPVVLTEVPVAERAPILRAWCQVATSGREHLPIAHDAPPSDFESIAADYPVFRIEPA